MFLITPAQHRRGYLTGNGRQYVAAAVQAMLAG
jgi:hypothetical protein